MKKFVGFAVAGLMVLLIAGFHLSCSSSSGGGGSSSEPTANLSTANVDKTLDYIAMTIPGCSQGALITANQVVLGTLSTTREQISQKQMRLSPQSNDFQPAADPAEPAINVEDTCVGSDGTMIGDITSDETTGNMSGTITFTDFCQGDPGNTVVVDGSLTFSGKMDVDSGDLESLSASSKGITMLVDEDGTERSYYASFDVSMSASGDKVTIKVNNFTFSDDTEGTEVKISDFTLTAVEGTTSTQLSMSGTISVTDQGTVKIATNGPITVSDSGDAVSGSMTITGAGNTQILLSIDDGIIGVQADTDGDGVYDYTPENMDCTGVALDGATL